MSSADRVVIGMDPHKRSVTIEVMAADETVHGGGRFGTDRDGYQALMRYARKWPDRVWAIEGCNGIGRPTSTTFNSQFRSSRLAKAAVKLAGICWATITGHGSCFGN